MQIERTMSKYQTVPLMFFLDPVAASLTDQQLPMNPADLLPDYRADGYVMPHAGFIQAISGRLSTAATTGTLTIGPTVNGTEQASLTTTVTTGRSPYGSAVRESVRFTAGDVLGAEVTTSGTWNATTAGLVVVVWAVLAVEGI